MDLSGSRATAGALDALEEMFCLHELNAHDTALAEKGIRELKRTLPKCEIVR